MRRQIELVDYRVNGRGMTRTQRVSLFTRSREERRHVRIKLSEELDESDFESIFGLDIVALPDGDLIDYVSGLSCLIEMISTVGDCAREINGDRVENLLHAQSVLLRLAELAINRIHVHKDIPKMRVETTCPEEVVNA